MRHQLVLSASCIAIIGGCADHETGDDPEFRIFGPTTTVVDNADSGFEAAVGRLFLFDGSGNGIGTCSATAITRSSIVTAKHCACAGVSAANSVFCLPQGGSGDMCTVLDGDEGFTSALTSFESHPSWANTCSFVDFTTSPPTSTDSSATGVDVAVAFLASNIPVSVVPTVPNVHLGNDPFLFGATESAAQGGAPRYFQVGFGDTNWSQDPPNNQTGVRRRGEAGSDLHWQSSAWGTVLETWFLESDANDDPGVANASTHASGDSGGALFMQPMDGPQRVGSPYLVGVISGASAVSWDDDQNWATTGSRNQHRDDFGNVKNSDLIALALAPDADQDGVLDGNDNCPPSACPINASSCANATQTDSDNDMLGDACDLCDDVKDAPALGVLGPDGDGDRVGDACDVCPLEGDPYQSDDDDDGVGDACDTCVEIDNPYAACTANNQCTSGWCIEELGVNGGRCSTQADDADGDGYGAACDGCTSNANDGIHELFANSNIDMEDFENVTALGDVCEAVPQYIVRPVLTPFEEQSANCPVGNTPETCRNVAKLFASATIGHSTGNNVAQYDADVGFRHCDCYDAAEDLLDRETCLATQCAILPADYSNPASKYLRISIGVNGGSAPVYPATLTETTFQRSFDSTVSGSDVYDHPDDQLEGDDEREKWRVGPTEMLLWPWKSDVVQGVIPGHPAASPVDQRFTGGIVWTFTNGKATTGSRDLAAGKRLRSVYTYVVTPLVAPMEPLGPMNWDPQFTCHGPDCYSWLRPGLDRINPPDYSFIDLQRDDMLLHEFAGDLVASVNKQPGAYQAKEFVAESVRSDLLAGKSMWLSPVEAEHVTRMLAAPGQGAYMPTEWTSSSQVHTLALEKSELVGTEVKNAGPFAPSDRSEYVALYSATDDAVFMLGGIDVWGANTQDIWRFDVASATWSPVIADGAGLQRVADAVYVPEDQRMIVVDRIDDSKIVRLLRVDLARNETQVLGAYHDAGIHTDIAVGYDGYGSFVLLLGNAEKDSIVGYRFAVEEGDIEAALVWIGEGELEGRLLGGPQLGDDGLVIPIELEDAPRLDVLDLELLGAATEGPKEL